MRMGIKMLGHINVQMYGGTEDGQPENIIHPATAIAGMKT